MTTLTTTARGGNRGAQPRQKPIPAAIQPAVPGDFATATAQRLLGGRVIVRTVEAMRALDLPCSAASVSAWRAAGKIPFAEMQLGRVFYTTAADVGAALLTARVARDGRDETLSDHVANLDPIRRGPGRPRKGGSGHA